MLPDTVYRLLPYVYIVTGVICALLIESVLVYVAAVLLVLGGFVVLWMRYAGGAHYRHINETQDSRPHEYSVAAPLKKERRQSSEKREFPLINNKGEIIALDRRIGSS